jgi:hypothetical protein
MWLKKSQPSKPWTALPTQVKPYVEAFSSIVISTEIGDDTNCLFWKDRWVLGQHIENFAPFISIWFQKELSTLELCLKLCMAQDGYVIFVE